METTNVSTLKIHKLTEDQYKRELAAGRIDENAIYLTPEVEYQDLGILDWSEGNPANILVDEGKYRYSDDDFVYSLIVERPVNHIVSQIVWSSEEGVETAAWRSGVFRGTGWEFRDWEDISPSGIVKYNSSQSLSDSQKTQARANIGAAPNFSTNPIIATSTDGVAYTATVDGLTELYVGCSLMIVPNMTSTSSSSVTLNVNNLGAVQIKRWDNISTNEWWGFPIAGWMKAGYPIRVKYTGVYWIIEGMSKTYATDLTGAVPIANGGTGATTAAAARTNLGAASASDLATLRNDFDVLAASAISVLSGTATPTSDIGNDGDIYLVTD